ncbi:hypothetical protein SAMN06297422_10698 [Lachnospiraceae bacterium]|nr:hypothetical protein SAMN06297422_10698 [Lachnospiraceae bacterium]
MDCFFCDNSYKCIIFLGLIILFYFVKALLLLIKNKISKRFFDFDQFVHFFSNQKSKFLNRRMLITCYRNNKIRTRIFNSLSCFILILLDVIIEVFILTFCFIFALLEQIFMIIGSILTFMRIINDWIINLSDIRVTVLLLRSTLMLSLTTVVIINQFDNIFINKSEGTSVLEFIASVIIIPLVMAWILEYKTE